MASGSKRKNDCYLEFLRKLEGCPEEKYIINRIWENKVEEISVS